MPALTPDFQFPSDSRFDLPEKFTDPFRYFPHPLVVKAASEVISRIDASEDLKAAFHEGKMLGILLCTLPSPLEKQPWIPGVTPSQSQSTPSHVITNHLHVIPNHLHVIPNLIWDLPHAHLGYLAAFSGNVGGKSHIEGFVPPIFDLLEPTGHFKIREAEISAINLKIKELEESAELSSLRSELAETERHRECEISDMKIRMTESKRRRDELRSRIEESSTDVSQPAPDSLTLDTLVRESQHEKAELRRLKSSWDEKISSLKAVLEKAESEISDHKVLRARMSDELQEWIFKQYIVHNSSGEESSIFDIFAGRGLVPPGGTGECAAPKLLEYAFRNGLKPVAMGEFWYGKSPDTAVRTHGHFYPSCTSKCGPLLGWMLRGLSVSGVDMAAGEKACGEGWGDGQCESISPAGVDIIYEDEVLLAVDKPSGVPSVPGLDGRVSAFEIMEGLRGELHAVHRLDMDTSGVLLFAKTAEAAVDIRKQFEEHTVRKTYRARLSPADSLHKHTSLELPGKQYPIKAGAKGRIELPLGPDYDERPRQKVDFKQGKAAVTEYEVLEVREDGTTDILFFPLTGRTHQLRVHAAHALGLNRPILGDPLYGGSPAPRLHLQAVSIILRHPTANRNVCIEKEKTQE